MSWIHTRLLQGMAVMPEALLWPFARRYVAGRTLLETLTAIKKLTHAGLLTTVDVLGESETEPQRIAQAAALYSQVLDTLNADGELEGNISLKLSQFGLLADPERCYQTVLALVQQAGQQFVRLDMEDSQCTDATLAIYRRLRQYHANVGIVLQARLWRTPDDLAALMADGIAHVRLCKGIYLEPDTLAYTQPDDITQAFLSLMTTMLTAAPGQVEKLAMATHDPVIVEHALGHLRTLPPSMPIEFQMLLGVREDVRQHLQHQQQPVRIYVPFGQNWKTYCVRRFRENPELLAHVLKSLLKV
jgi:proline dehydrogenase